MPYKIRKLPGRKLYRVYNAETKQIMAHGTTLEKARKQVRLLDLIEIEKSD